MTVRSLPAACAVVLLVCSSVVAQEFRPGLSGIVRDPQGAVMPGVRIEARNLDTNQLARTTTNEAGFYVFPVLPAGIYSVTAAADGFKKAAREKLELRGGDRVQLDFELELGAVADQITVTGEPELLDTGSASGGQVVDSDKVRDLPTVARNTYLIGVIAAGVMFDIGENQLSRSARPFDAGNNVAESMSVNGGRPGASDLLLDGVPNTSTESTSPANMGYVPSPDATQQFKIQTNTYDAQYGRTSGGVISVSLKSGTNKLRGTLYEYFRHDVLNANLFQSNRVGAPKTGFRWNQPGLEVDGPVMIPRLYDGRGRTFFMYAWEAVRSSIPTPVTASVPMPEQLKGDFTKTLQTNGQMVAMYDPLTTVQTSPGAYSRQPFAGNRIALERMDPVALKMIPYITAPNIPGATTQNLVVGPNPRLDVYDSHTVRIDHIVSDRNRFFSRFVRGNRHEVNGYGAFQGPASQAYRHQRQNQGASFDLTTMLSPSALLTTRVGWSRHKYNIELYAGGFDPTQLGFPASLVNQLPAKTFPQVQMTNYSSFGAGRNQGDEFSFSNTWSWSETVNKTIRSHSVKFGGEFRVNLNNQNVPTSNFGTFAFTNTFTQANPLSGSAASGNAVASLLLGIPNSGTINTNAAKAYAYRYYAVFLQDDWRISRTVTVNLGLRWDYESPVTERYDQQNAGFDYTAASPLQAPGYNLKGGLLFTDSKHRLPYQRDLNNVQPRIGLAWRLAPKTVLRTGYGRSYFATFTMAGNQGFSLTTPYVSTDGGVFLNSNRLPNPYPEGIRQPYGRTQGLATMMGQSITFTIPDRVIPHIHQFSLGLQRELRWRTVVEVSYVGSRTIDLETSQSIDDVTAQQLAQYGNTLSSSVPNPFANLLPGTNLNAATTTRQQLLRPYPQFTGVTQQRNPAGRAWYNSLQVRVDKRLSHGLNFLLSYTRARNLEAVGYLNPQDPIDHPSRSLVGTDTPHRLAVSGGWALPIFSRAKGIQGLLLKGWQLNTIFVRQVGFPLAAPSGYYSSGIDPSLPASRRTNTRYFNTCVLTTSGVRQNCASPDEPVAFIQQPAYSLRTLSGRFPTIRPPRVPNVDVSMFKMITLHERFKLQFRAEAFNMTNSPQLGNPSTSLGSTTAGQRSLSQSNDPRSVQLALRLMF